MEEATPVDFMDLVRTRRSIRKYRPEPIPQDALERVIQAALLAPWGDGGSKVPPTRLIVARDQDTRHQIMRLCEDQRFIAEAPVVIIAYAQETKAYSRGGWMGRYSVIVDVSIAMDHLMLAARAEGLGTCWIGSFDNDGLRSLFSLPEGVNVIAVMPIGYPDGDLLTDSRDRRRPSLDEVARWV